MASLYKKPVILVDPKTKRKQKTESKKWWGRYVDADGVERRVPLAENKKIAQRLLAELVEQSEQGLVNDPFVEANDTPISVHLENFERHMTAKNDDPAHVRQTRRRVERYIAETKRNRIVGIDAGSVETFIAKLRKSENLSLQTCNHYIRAIKHFCNWLVKYNKLARHPLLAVELFNAEEDRRHARRALTQDEFQYLLHAAKTGKNVEGISGTDRHMFYILAAWTGFRKGELGSLTLRHFNLDGVYPTVRIAASYSKRRREDVQFLHPDVVAIFRDWVTKKKPGMDEILFPVSEKSCGLERKTSEMMERDLQSARKMWIEESETENERQEREASDFLKYVDSHGKFADFHGLRHTFVTNLCRAGVSPQTAQILARHSDIKLTMNIYTHVAPEEQAAAIRQLPGIGKTKNGE